MAKLHSVVMLVLGVAVLAAVAAASPVAPRGNLEVTELSASRLHAKFKSGNAHIHGVTTNSSVRVHNVDPAPVGSAAFVVGSERKIVHGEATGKHTAARIQLLDKVFLSLTSKGERTVVMEVPEEAASYDAQLVDDMYLESPRIVPGVRASLKMFEEKEEEISARHTDSLTALVDMAWQAGANHGVTGMDFPHSLKLHVLALEISKSLDDYVDPPPVEHASTSRRALQSAPSNCEEKGFFDCGGAFTLPVSRSYGGTEYCCPETGATSQQCGASTYPDSDCTGMCGRRCNCQPGICGDCCWYQVCADHDECCDQRGMTDSACMQVLSSFFLHHSSFSCYSQYPGCNTMFSGH